MDDTRQVRRQLSSPELSAKQFEEVLAELDAICRQARELSTQIKRQMAQQKFQEQQLAGIIRFSGRA